LSTIPRLQHLTLSHLLEPPPLCGILRRVCGFLFLRRVCGFLFLRRDCGFCLALISCTSASSPTSSARLVLPASCAAWALCGIAALLGRPTIIICRGRWGIAALFGRQTIAVTSLGLFVTSLGLFVIAAVVLSHQVSPRNGIFVICVFFLCVRLRSPKACFLCVCNNFVL